jgi:16S rRNA (adenine1518-N6/adenine1519-N6)-dimethyltransferase
VNPAYLDAIVRAADLTREDAVLEIGAGAGLLTARLGEQAGVVVAVEIDRGVIPALREVVADLPAVRVVEADAMSLDLAAQFPSGHRRKVVSNLPYQIASPLVVRMLEEIPNLDRMVITVQREVAERMQATPGSPAYGLLSVLVARRGAARIVRRVPPGAFLPPPRVESAIVSIVPRTLPRPADPALLDALIRAAFAQRRKQLGNAWARWDDPPGRLAAAAAEAGIELRRRGETLSLEEFGAMADALSVHARSESGETVRRES